MFDFLTFYVLLSVLHAGERVSKRVGSSNRCYTQVLVIFVIHRTRGFLRNRAHPLLAMTSILVIMLAILLPLTPLGGYFGFVPLPLHFYLILGGMVVLYLLAVEFAKQTFTRWQLIRFYVRTVFAPQVENAPGRRLSCLRWASQFVRCVEGAT